MNCNENPEERITVYLKKDNDEFFVYVRGSYNTKYKKILNNSKSANFGIIAKAFEKGSCFKEYYLENKAWSEKMIDEFGDSECWGKIRMNSKTYCAYRIQDKNKINHEGVVLFETLKNEYMPEDNLRKKMKALAENIYSTNNGLNNSNTNIFIKNLEKDSLIKVYRDNNLPSIIGGDYPDYEYSDSIIKKDNIQYEVKYQNSIIYIATKDFSIPFKSLTGGKQKNVWEYVFQHPNKKITKTELKKIISNIDSFDRLDKTMYNIFANKDFIKLLFPTIGTNEILISK